MGASEITEKRQGKKDPHLEPLASGSNSGAKYSMRLFIAGDEPNSVIAQRNIRDICSEHLEGNFKLDVIDVFEDYTAAIEENILVSPALVIDQPQKAKIFGNLQNKERVLSALELI